MAYLNIPLSSVDPSFSRRFQLDDATFVLSFDWSEVAGYWFLSVADLDGVELASGIKVVTQWPLLRQHQDVTTFPKGDLIFVDPGEGGPPGRNELGERVTLVYVEEESL